MARSRAVIQKQRGKAIPKKCPQCRSQKLELMERTVEIEKEIVTLKGWFCQRCGFQNCRRYI